MGGVEATTYYLVGDFNSWKESSTYAFTVDGTTATLSLTGAQINKSSTEFLIKAVESSSNYWYLKNSSATTVTVDGDAVTASSFYNKNQNCNYSVSGLSTSSTTTYTFTLTATSSDINSSTLKITSSTTSSGDDSGSGSSTSTSSAEATGTYYLVTNFLGTSKMSNTSYYDGTSINYNRKIFKFTPDENGVYSISIPATVTGHAQILDATNSKVYGPGSAYNFNDTWPTVTNYVGSVTNQALTSSSTLAEGSNYWNFTTRNAGTDNNSAYTDGMYTISFTIGSDGTPSKWSVNYTALQRVAYVLSTSDDAIAQPIYDARSNSSAEFDNAFFGSVYIDKGDNYYLLSNYPTNNDNMVSNVSNLGLTLGYGPLNNYTVNKLIIQGNGGNTWEQSDDHNKVYPENSYLISSKSTGSYIVQYNPTTANNDKLTNGMGGELWFYTGSTLPDLTSVSMVGTAVPGTTTTSGTTTTWNWTSTAGDMTYDETEGCWKLTLNTSADDGATTFRFVANHLQTDTWYEDGTTSSNPENMAKTPYTSTTATGHTCLADDPNEVSFTTTDNTSTTDVNILFNRPAGIWTVKFYIKVVNGGTTSGSSRTAKYTYYYTITGGTKVVIPLTYRCDKFIRTYSSAVALSPVDDNVKIYEAYKYEQPSTISDNYSEGKVYLRQLSYIPANMGVVLVGEAPSGTNYSDGDKLDFTVTTYSGTDDPATTTDTYPTVWTKYTSTYKSSGDAWNNYLVPTLTAVNDLGNAATDADGNVTYRYFGLGHYFATNYYKSLTSTSGVTDYIGFFRLTSNGKSGANKAYLKIPANATVDNAVGVTFGYIPYNGQLINDATEDNSSLGK